MKVVTLISIVGSRVHAKLGMSSGPNVVTFLGVAIGRLLAFVIVRLTTSAGLCPLVSIRVVRILEAFTPCVSIMARQRTGIVRLNALTIAVVGISLSAAVVVVVVAAAAIATVIVSTAAIIISAVVIPVAASGVVCV